jgi:hypothetical protein
VITNKLIAVSIEDPFHSRPALKYNTEVAGLLETSFPTISSNIPTISSNIARCNMTGISPSTIETLRSRLTTATVLTQDSEGYQDSLIRWSDTGRKEAVWQTDPRVV